MLATTPPPTCRNLKSGTWTWTLHFIFTWYSVSSTSNSKPDWRLFWEDVPTKPPCTATSSQVAINWLAHLWRRQVQIHVSVVHVPLQQRRCWNGNDFVTTAICRQIFWVTPCSLTSRGYHFGHLNSSSVVFRCFSGEKPGSENQFLKVGPVGLADRRAVDVAGVGTSHPQSVPDPPTYRTYRWLFLQSAGFRSWAA